MQLDEIQQIPTELLEEVKRDLILQPLNSAEELRAWIYVFFDIRFPMGVVYPDSTHGPVDAMWEIYRLIKTGESADCPQVTMLSSRDSYKTLCAAALEVLCMLHFEVPVAHMAAIKSQSAKAIQYINGFFRRVKPYIEANGWQKKSDSKTYIDWITPNNQTVWLNIVTATIAGANCVEETTTFHTTNGLKQAKDLVQGDRVLSFDVWNQEPFESEVMGVGRLKAASRDIQFDDGSNLVLSHYHKVFTQKGWVNAGKLRYGDSVIGLADTFNTEYSIDQVGSKKWTLKSMLFGTLLGDASIQELPSGSCRYQVFHCKEQLPYLKKIKQTFKENEITAKIVPDKEGYRLYTQTHEYFKQAYRLCYPDGKKVTPGWIANLDLESIAFLIMDDGTAHSKNPGKFKEHNINIATLSFSDYENQLIADRISELGYEAKLTRFNDRHNQVSLSLSSSRDISQDIQQYVLPCLSYKLVFGDTNKFCIDTGAPVESTSNNFSWQDKDLANCKKGGDFRKNIKKFFNKKITNIVEVGEQNLVGITIKDEDFNKKSFYANGILVHNSEHVPLLFIDEVDVVQDPRALKEAKMIPSMWGNYFPLTIYLSTRKFAGGLMEKTLEETVAAGGKILRWNIIDVAERISEEVALTHLPKVKRYVSLELPMETLLPDQWEALPVESKVNYEEFMAYQGIANHPLLPVMRNYLVDRPQDDHGDLYKPVVAVHNNFKQVPPDMGEAQLLCKKPSTSGLVYKRFDPAKNVLTPEQAIDRIMGEEMGEKSFDYLKDYIINSGVPIIGGADWGFTDLTAMVIMALMPNGDVYLLDTLALPGLEMDDIVKYGSIFQEEWGVRKWYVDQAYPAYIKTLRRKSGWRVPTFKKDVAAGIAALQSKIVNSSNTRKFFIISQPANEQTIKAFGSYKWATDGKGDIIEGKPEHGNDGTADIMDAIRYPAQNLFIKGAKPLAMSAGGTKPKPKAPSIEETKKMAETLNEKAMKNKISELAPGSSATVKKKGKIFWG